MRILISGRRSPACVTVLPRHTGCVGLEGYVMFRKDIMGKRGGGVLLYIKETIPEYEVQLQRKQIVMRPYGAN